MTPSTPPERMTLSVASGPEQAPVLITGGEFGREPGSITFNGVAAQPITWTDAAVLTAVPYGASTGELIITTAEGRSASALFTVEPGVWNDDDGGDT